MQEILFKVQGSASEPYDVVFGKGEDRSLSASCSCTGAKNGKHCKHRIYILEGKTEGIISNNLEEVKTVQSWLPGTDVEDALIKIQKLEAEEKRIKKELTSVKKALVKAML